MQSLENIKKNNFVSGFKDVSIKKDGELKNFAKLNTTYIMVY